MRRASLIVLAFALPACDTSNEDGGAGVIVLDGGGAGGGGGKQDGTTDAAVGGAGGGAGGEAGAGGAGGAGGGVAPCEGLPVLGCGGDLSKVQVEVLGGRNDGLRVPRDLDFNPEVPGELWVVNRQDDSTSTFQQVGTPDQTVIHRRDPFAEHFMEEVSSIAFGAPGTFATCQESDNRYNNQAPPNGFMGPSLWPSDMDVYGFSNPQAVRSLGYDLGSHLDMLHESPFCMGIAWEKDNVYWVFEGVTSSLMRADFQEDHGVGYDDHSDGIMMRYAEGNVRRVPNVPSHLVFEDGLLYIADTGNGRLGVLNTEQLGATRRVFPVEPGTQVGMMEGTVVNTLGDTEALESPSGLALHDGILYVTDNATSEISAWTRAGELIDVLHVDVEMGGLMGITLDEQGRIYVVDAQANQLLRISPR